LLNIDLALLADSKERLFLARLHRVLQLARIGKWAEAQGEWDKLQQHRFSVRVARHNYVDGDEQLIFAQFRFWKGDVQPQHFNDAESHARHDHNRRVVRSVHALRGAWSLDRGDCVHASESLSEAVAMARAAGQQDTLSETKLVVALLQIGRLPDADRQAELLSQRKRPAHVDLGHLWRLIGDPSRAREHALAGYKWAWSDGEPY